jgi:ribosome-associated translation inhibitor RaiA
MINIVGYDIPTSISEMTIAEFESLNVIMNNSENLQIERYVDYIEKYIKGDDLYSVSDEEIFNLVELVNKKEDISRDLIKSFEIDGYNYVSYIEEFKITAIELSLIEKKINKNPSKYFSYIIAILFKREDLTNKEHYTDAHLKHKEDLFSKQKADIFYPFILAVADKLAKNIKKYDITE